MLLPVEDNKSDAMLTIRALKKLNLANVLIHLTDGAQALDFLFETGACAARNMEDKPKVILLYLKMPKVSGLEVLRIIKADDRTKLIPVVMMISSKQEKYIIESHHLGVNSHVVKPVGYKKFSKIITDLGIYQLEVNNSPQH